jgi:hypothetical protein
VCGPQGHEGENRNLSTTSKDVLEVPDVVVKLSDERRAWTYGSVGVGVDYGPKIWKEHHHVFAAHAQQTTHVEPSAAVQLGDPNRLQSDVLNRHPVDCLLMEGDLNHRWISWIREAEDENRPKAMMIFAEGAVIEDEEAGIPKVHRKFLNKLGYDVRYWYIQAWKYGAALDLSTVCMVWYRTSDTASILPSPRSSMLPVRPMSNLLKPFGVPRKAWTNRKPKSLTHPKQGPCKIVGHIGGEFVYDELGAMPNTVGSWISTTKGIRRLQYEELAKAKGMDDLVVACDRMQTRVSVRKSKGIHVWSAALEALGCWMREPEVEDPRSTHDEPPGEVLSWDLEDDVVEETWQWKPPDLRVEGSWYQDRVKALKEAIHGRSDATKLYQEGLAALDCHRSNYTDEGPKFLQLLWWEFPKEHWDALRLGSSMNFLIQPSGELILNSEMNEIELKAAGKFVDELISLGVLQPAKEELLGNCPLFCVDKPLQPGEKRCIADMKRGGQNACIGKDPVYLTQKRTILAQLYTKGWSAVADASKQFHNFPTLPEERKYLGCIHPITGANLVYCGLPMGSANSPAISCRITNGGIRSIRERESLFQGSVLLNTWASKMADGTYDVRVGHGRVIMGDDGLPAALIWVMVDDFLIHAPTQRKCYQAFSLFMDHMVRMGFICQCVKTSPPAQEQKFCGMIFDTRSTPTMRIPMSKVSRTLATLARVGELNDKQELTRLAGAVVGGLCQSLVDATPARQGQTYLRALYDNIHHTSKLYGRALYYTKFQLSPETLEDLQWWEEFLSLNPGNTSRAGHMQTMGVTWGDGSGTGTGGTFEVVQHQHTPVLETWMGTWAAHVAHFDSNWRELRTLLWTLERLGGATSHGGGASAVSCLSTKPEPARGALDGGTLFYFTDNMVTYYIVHNGSSTSPALHSLIRRIKIIELRLGCRLEPIHVPGRLMIVQGTDGLSRGMWVSADHLLRSSVAESRLTLEAVPYTSLMGAWALQRAGLPVATPHWHITDDSEWSWAKLGDQVSIWTPSPEIAHQAITTFLDLWVERPATTAALFLIPRVLQRDWGFLSKHVQELGIHDPMTLPWGCRYSSLIPLCLLYVPRYVRVLPPLARLDVHPSPTGFQRWCQHQAEELRRL